MALRTGEPESHSDEPQHRHRTRARYTCCRGAKPEQSSGQTRGRHTSLLGCRSVRGVVGSSSVTGQHGSEVHRQVWQMQEDVAVRLANKVCGWERDERMTQPPRQREDGTTQPSFGGSHRINAEHVRRDELGAAAVAQAAATQHETRGEGVRRKPEPRVSRCRTAHASSWCGGADHAEGGNRIVVGHRRALLAHTARLGIRIPSMLRNFWYKCFFIRSLPHFVFTMPRMQCSEQRRRAKGSG
eukprot:5097396-Prymnesium_polylepis.3